jgi:predicted SprT family Zn-dependent metalloprotease
MEKMFDLDYDTREFKPTVEWMTLRYNEANQKLFGGELGKCYFSLFTTGKGSQGKTNGYFTMQGKPCAYAYDRRLFKMSPFNEKIYVNRGNFFEIAKPLISLNGNKSGSEWAFMVTLVHEMCHYYTYQDGYVPDKAHGPEFVSIANYVTQRSGGQIEVTKKTTIERSQHFSVDDKIQARLQARLNKARATRKSHSIIAVAMRSKGEWSLCKSLSQQLINNFAEYMAKDANVIKVVQTNDANVIDLAESLGYRRNFVIGRRYSCRWWPLKDHNWLIEPLLNAETKDIYVNPSFMESKKTLKSIVREAIENLISKETGNDVIEITPDMDLDEFSPLELS